MDDNVPRRGNSVAESTGNVFADLGVAESAAELAKAQLAGQTRQTIEYRRLSQAESAKLMDLDQPKVSALMNGRLSGFSSDRLLRYLTALGRDVEIAVTAKPQDRGRERDRGVEGVRRDYLPKAAERVGS